MSEQAQVRDVPRILSVDVDWMEGWGNYPRFVVELSSLCKSDDMVYEQRGPFYLAHYGAHATFFYYTGPDTGYGGREFRLRMQDGTTKYLIGPWSSRSGCINRTFPELHVVEAHNERRIGFSVCVADLLAWCVANKPGFSIARVTEYGNETHYEPMRGSALKNEHNRKAAYTVVYSPEA